MKKQYDEPMIIEHYQRLGLEKTVRDCEISKSQIYRILTKNNAERRYHKTTLSEKDKIKLLYDDGMSLAEISRQIGCSVDFVTDFITDNNLRKKMRQKRVNFNPFENYLNPHVQYWLGILTTDGTITEGNRVTLSQCDNNVDIILKFKEFLKSDVTIKAISKTDWGKTYYGKSISFRNKEVFTFLNDVIGITPNKTDTLKIKIPITFDFLRGCIDGDGSIEKDYARIRLASNSPDFIKQISNLLKEFSITHGIYRRKNKDLLDLQVNEHYSILKLIDFLYYNGCTYFERKYINAQYIRENMLKLFKFRELSLENPERNQQDELE